MTSTLQETWAVLQFAFIVMVFIIALWRTIHAAAMEAHGGATRLGNFLHDVFGRK